MNLKEYLTGKSMTETAFAEEIGVAQVTVNRWVRGERFPEPEMIMRVAAATNGEVSVSDWYGTRAAKAAAE